MAEHEKRHAGARVSTRCRTAVGSGKTRPSQAMLNLNSARRSTLLEVFIFALTQRFSAVNRTTYRYRLDDETCDSDTPSTSKDPGIVSIKIKGDATKLKEPTNSGSILLFGSELYPRRELSSSLALAIVMSRALLAHIIRGP